MWVFAGKVNLHYFAAAQHSVTFFVFPHISPPLLRIGSFMLISSTRLSSTFQTSHCYAQSLLTPGSDSVLSTGGAGQIGLKHPDWEEWRHRHQFGKVPSCACCQSPGDCQVGQQMEKAYLQIWTEIKEPKGCKETLFHRWKDWISKQEQEAPKIHGQLETESDMKCYWGHWDSTPSLECWPRFLLCDLRKMINLPQPPLCHL